MIENIIFLIASFIAAIVATLAGFGSSTLLIPVAVMFMDLKTAVLLVACFHLFNNSFKIKMFWNKIDFKTFLLFGIPSIIFAFIGARLISIIPIGIVKRILAIFLIIFSIYSFIKPKFAIKETKTTAIVGGGLSGFLAGLVGLGGAIRSTFLIVFNLPKEVYIATSAAIAFVIDLTRIPTYLFTGVTQDTSYYILLPFLVVSAYFGVKIGKVLLGKVSQSIFKRIVLIGLLLVGIKLFF
ncbi:MAG: sulfite exporter TauE/SafE family protein [Omnitrophica bacterium]|nr:sulfite exporter TauE/SafE family protein [Candidatus Omnitrophota bacterium]